MALTFELQLGNSGKFEASAAAGTTTTDGGTVIATILLKCSRPLLRAEVANADSSNGATLTWQYQCHDNATWTALPSGAGSQPATLAASATTQFLINTEAMYAVRLRAYHAADGTKAIAWRGNVSDKSPSSSVAYNTDIGDVNLLNAAGTKINPAVQPSGVATAGAALTVAAAAWNNSGSAAAIPANTMFVIINPTVNCCIVCNTTASDPAADAANVGVIYLANQVHKIHCIGQTYLHYQGTGTAGTATWTAFAY